MLTALQQSIVLHEIAKAVSPEGMLTTTDYAETLGLTRKNYYDHVKKPALQKAITDGIENASKSSDYFALVTRQVAVESLRSLITDKDTQARDRISAIKTLTQMTEYATQGMYQIPYIHLSDEELYELAVARKERLNLSDEEYRALQREIEQAHLPKEDTHEIEEN